MTEEEVFKENYDRIQYNIQIQFNILVCDQVVNCDFCKEHNNRGGGCSKRFLHDFIIFKRKKKLEKLLS